LLIPRAVVQALVGVRRVHGGGLAQIRADAGVTTFDIAHSRFWLSVPGHAEFIYVPSGWTVGTSRIRTLGIEVGCELRTQCGFPGTSRS
jgi:hypothetical protein